MVVGLSGGETVGGVVVMVTRKPFSMAPVGLAAMVDGGGLRRAGGAGGDRDDYIFINDRRRAAGAGLADAIEIGVVVLAREVVADAAVAEGQVFPAKNCCGGAVGILRQSGGDAAERTGGGFFVEDAARIEGHGAQRGVARLVSLYVIDSGITREGAEERLQAGARFHAAVAEDYVLAIGRDPVRQFRRRQIGDQPAENFDGRVE